MFRDSVLAWKNGLKGLPSRTIPVKLQHDVGIVKPSVLTMPNFHICVLNQYHSPLDTDILLRSLVRLNDPWWKNRSCWLRNQPHSWRGRRLGVLEPVHLCCHDGRHLIGDSWWCRRCHWCCRCCAPRLQAVSPDEHPEDYQEQHQEDEHCQRDTNRLRVNLEQMHPSRRGDLVLMWAPFFIFAGRASHPAERKHIDVSDFMNRTTLNVSSCTKVCPGNKCHAVAPS